MTYTKEHLDSVTAGDVSRAVSVSERTLRRLFQDTLRLSWRTYLLHARMLRAMALLAAPGQSVQETSTAVGFDSLSSFTRAFAQFCGKRRRPIAKGLVDYGFEALYRLTLGSDDHASPRSPFLAEPVVIISRDSDLKVIRTD
jgi:hypothetical protein